MKTGTCPKCAATSVVSLGKRRANGISALNISQFSSAWLDNYVCTACGYVESYVIDQGDLAKIAKRGRAVGK